MKKVLKNLFVLVLFIPAFVYAKPANEAFDDDNFYKCVVDSYNSTHGDATKQYSDNLTDVELEAISELNCSNKEIVSTKGLEKLTGLSIINLQENLLTEIDLGKNINVVFLNLSKNKLTKIDLNTNTKLQELYLSENNITNIDLRQNDKINTLDVNTNKLSTIDLTKLVELKVLNLSSNNLTSINLEKNTKITKVELQNNNLLSLDLVVQFGNKDAGLIESLTTNYKNQTRTIKVNKVDGKFVLNLKEIDKNLNSAQKVKFDNTESITFDKESGIFTFSGDLPSNLKYNYIPTTYLPDEDIDDMDVTLTLIDGTTTDNGAAGNENEDKPAENPKTGGIGIGLITLAGVGIYLVYRYNKKNDKISRI